MLKYPISSPYFHRRKNKTFRRVCQVLLVLCLSILVFSSFFFVQLWAHFSKDLPETGAIVIQGEESSEILDRNGNVLKILYLTERRIYVSLSEISPFVIDAAVASEDERFFNHKGFDARAVARATLKNLVSRDYVEGGSTITQQLARNVFLERDKTIVRKIRELILSMRIEQRFTKLEILEFYLNQAYFGEGCYGVETASRKYFGKNAKELDLAEASLLISVLPAPSVLSLFSSYERAKIYQKNVLQKMVDNFFISPEEAQKAFFGEVTILNPHDLSFSDNETILPDNADYFIDYVKEDIFKTISAQELYKGGLRIHTTLHPSIQRLCNQEFVRVLAQAEKDGNLPSNVKDHRDVMQPQGAVVAFSPISGEVLAMVGGRDYANTKFNRALAERSSGSSFKIFPYTAAIDRGLLGPESILVSEPVNIDGWRPLEWTPGFFGAMNARRAMGISSNIAAVKTALIAGLDHTASYAEKMGLTTPMLAVPSMALGSLEVRPLDMAVANAVLANGGKRHAPIALKKIERRKTGEVLFETQSLIDQVISPQTAYLMTELLKEPFTSSGTASSLRIPGVHMAGKTGTTENFRDGWFVGFTPSIVLSVYVGSDSKEIDLSAVRNYGSVFAGQIFKNIVQILYQQKFFVDADWGRPQGLIQVRICRTTGLKANSTCSVLLDTRVDTSLSQCQIQHAAPEEKKEDPLEKEKDLRDPPEKNNIILPAPPPPDPMDPGKPIDPVRPPEDDSPGSNEPDRSIYAPPSVDTGDFSIYFGSANMRLGSPTEIGFNIFDPQGRSIDLFLNGNLVAILTDYPHRFYYMPDKAGINLLQAILRNSRGEIIGNKIMNFYVFQ